MAQIYAAYRRTFQVRPYESETVEVSITDEVDETAVDSKGTRGPSARAEALAELAKDLHLSLSDVGDRLVVERIARAPRSGAELDKTNPWS